jgi:opacity protein-like surface antigen
MLQVKKMSGWRVVWAMAAVLAVAVVAQGQSTYSASGVGPSLFVGAEYANLQAGFPINSDTRLSGVGGFVNYNWSHSIGMEARARFLNFGSWYGETQQDYLVGPRYTFLHSNTWHPYAIFNVGLVKIQYPFSMGNGTSFAMAPGGGLEYRMSHKIHLRAGYEYQMLTNSPDFTDEPKFGIRPSGFTAGVSYRIF